MQVFKILQIDEWERAQEAGVYRGSFDDKRDGFIHLSTGAQLPQTLNRHFAHATGLMLVAMESDDLGDKLKWETNADGETFPHLYHALEFPWVRWTSAIPNKAPGVFALPPQAFVQTGKPAGTVS
ncbi:MAG TPA: DUF952 domain-containing protein [Rhizomicrobium sp.]